MRKCFRVEIVSTLSCGGGGGGSVSACGASAFLSLGEPSTTLDCCDDCSTSLTGIVSVLETNSGVGSIYERGDSLIKQGGLRHLHVAVLWSCEAVRLGSYVHYVPVPVVFPSTQDSSCASRRGMPKHQHRALLRSYDRGVGGGMVQPGEWGGCSWRDYLCNIQQVDGGASFCEDHCREGKLSRGHGSYLRRDPIASNGGREERQYDERRGEYKQTCLST